MKNFKRKLARLFGLALRSDLEDVTTAYRERDESASYYFKQLEELCKKP